MSKCKFCNEEFSLNVVKLHKERCAKNPKNIAVDTRKDTDNENDLTKNEDKETEEHKADSKSKKVK